MQVNARVRGEPASDLGLFGVEPLSSTMCRSRCLDNEIDRGRRPRQHRRTSDPTGSRPSLTDRQLVVVPGTLLRGQRECVPATRIPRFVCQQLDELRADGLIELETGVDRASPIAFAVASSGRC
jgi:hypothetical protein